MRTLHPQKHARSPDPERHFTPVLAQIRAVSRATPHSISALRTALSCVIAPLQYLGLPTWRGSAAPRRCPLISLFGCQAWLGLCG